MYYKLRHPCEYDQVTEAWIDLTTGLAVFKKMYKIFVQTSNSRISDVKFSFHPGIDMIYITYEKCLIYEELQWNGDFTSFFHP